MGKYACLMLPMPPSVNNLFVNNRRTGGRFPSGQYKAWQEEAGRQLLMQKRPKCFETPVSLTLSFGRPDNRRRDISNYIKSVEDLLVKHNVIEDDSLVHRLVAVWDRDVTGVRVEIEPAGVMA